MTFFDTQTVQWIREKERMNHRRTGYRTTWRKKLADVFRNMTALITGYSFVDVVEKHVR